MSDLDRLLKLSGQKAQSQTQETTERKFKEAVGEFAEPIYQLCDEVGCDPDHPIFAELVRYMSGDQIKDFVADYRRHHDMNDVNVVDDNDPRYADDENLPKDESVEPTEPSKEEGNKFSGELAKAKEDGEDEFEVDGEKYKVKKEEFSGELEEKAKPDFADIDGDGDEKESMKKAAKDKEAKEESVEEGKLNPGLQAYLDKKKGKESDDKEDDKEDKKESVEENEDWVREANRIKELAGIKTISDIPTEELPTEEAPVEEAPIQEGSKTMKVDKLVPLAMDSIWDKEKENPKQVKVSSISINNPYEPGGYMDDEEDDSYRSVNVEHDGPWTIYTDSGFEKAISQMVGFEVDFTEQGMQEDGMASMEGMMNDNIKSEAFANYKPTRFKDMPKGMNEGDKEITRGTGKKDLEKSLDKLYGPKKGEKKEETIEEAPTMDTTQLITLLKNAGLTEEQIKQRVDEWANTPAVGASEDKETSHGEPYENFAQSVNLSLKRYLDAEDFKVQGLKEHKVEDIKEAYKKSKNKDKEDKKDKK